MIDTIDHVLRKSQNVLIDTHPSVKQLGMTATRWYTRLWIHAATAIGDIRYDAPVDPAQLYWVDPKHIRRTVSWTEISTNRKRDEHPQFRNPKYRLAGRVFSGEWDRVDTRFNESTVYRSFLARFDRGVTWEETDFYKESTSAIKNGATLWGCSTRDEFDRRCKQLDTLYNRIASGGYKTQNELYEYNEQGVGFDHIGRVVWGEIAVNVGRDGEFIFQDGRNRLAMAKIQDLESVPVVILVRHKKWQRLRDQVVRGQIESSELQDQIRSHPDILDLV
ncbi:hypothetical protein [Natronocalculus amylovorans]|uniref:Uncharacterized protein n=1 Tax=Natronocalculus amylovorans TaxID=2917812 RepID=A0AAE3G035_9EURY|nr:hypothetical protein [Natronocalculus amylovorans]MCL9818301.1 hypothetical protein [Natronocalculus amylovorans]